MSVLPVHLAIEDQLSEAVLRKLLQHSGRGYAIGHAYGRSGYGYLRKTIRGWNRASRSTPFVVLTDLDDRECAPTLISDWLGREPIHPNLILRVAVREVESWLLGDRSNLAAYLGVRADLIPHDPDDLANPKLKLVQIARASRSAQIKAQLVPKANSTAKQGPEYNSCLIEFVNYLWDIGEATQNSPSLDRAINRLLKFQPTWE